VIPCASHRQLEEVGSFFFFKILPFALRRTKESREALKILDG